MSIDIITTQVPGLRGPGLTDADLTTLDAKVTAAQAAGDTATAKASEAAGYVAQVAPLVTVADATYSTVPAFPLARIGNFGGMKRVYQAQVRGGADTIMRLPAVMKRRGNYVDLSRNGLAGLWMTAIVSRPGMSGIERRFFAVHGKSGETHLRFARRIKHGRNEIDWSFDGKRGPHSFVFAQRLKSAAGDVERVAFSVGRENGLRMLARPVVVDDHPTGAYRAWSAKVSGTYQVFVQDAATGAIAQITSAGTNIPTGFSHDGTKLYYETDRARIVQRLYQPLNSAAAKVSVTGKVLTVVSVLRGSFVIGQKLTGLAAGTMITSANADGTFGISVSQTVTNQLVYAAGGIELAVLTSRLITAFGDSMTEFASTGYTPVIAPLLPGSVVLYPQGIGGQRSQEIVARMGAVALTGTVTGGVIPTSGSAALTGLNINLLRGSGNKAIRAMIAGVLGNLAYTSSSNSYTFTPITYPASAVTAAGTQSITVKSGFASGTTANNEPSIEAMLGGEVYLRIGRNDIGKTSADVNGGAFSQATVIACMVAAYQALKAACPKFVNMTVINGSNDLPTTYTTAPFTSGGTVTASPADINLAQIAALNAAVLAHATLGPLTIDPQQGHIDAGETAAATVNGTTYQVVSQTVDGTHETAAALLTTTNLILSTRTAKGF